MITSPNLSRPDLTAAAGSSDRWFPTMTEERRRLEEDQEALRERENNLREYEARLRALQAEIEDARSAPASAPGARTGVTPSIFHRESTDAQAPDEPALNAAWEKLHRAREILEAEQAHLRDDRLALHEQETTLQRREEAVTERERQLAERETTITPPVPEATVGSAERQASVAASISRAPFNFARRMLGKPTA